MSVLGVRYHRGGIYLPALGLWLDPHEPQTGSDLVFVSHAHFDHLGAHREMILTEGTARLMRARMRGDWKEHLLGFNQPVVFQGKETSYTVTLLPAGHILGSSMLLIEASGERLLYTGDFKLRPGHSAERCQPQQADVLIMECTYGKRDYRFPPSLDVIRNIVRFCKETLANNETPVLLGYSLGKSQELLCGLADAGLPLVLHEQVFQLTELYRSLGHVFPSYEKFDKNNASGKVLLWPPQSGNSGVLRQIAPVRTAILTGWAVDPQCRYRYQTDAAFPLSDHADFPELIEMVQQVRPKKIYAVHGFTNDFAGILRELGYDAHALGQEEQLSLPFQQPVLAVSGARDRHLRRKESPLLPGVGNQVTGRASDADWVREPSADRITKLDRELAPIAPESFHAFANTCLAIGSTPKKLEKIRILADYLVALDSPELTAVNSWFTGNPFPPTENKVLRLGWAIIRDALCEVVELDHAAFGQIYLKHSDLGEAAFEILMMRAGPAGSLRVADVRRMFEQIYIARGPVTKLPLLAQGLRQCTPLEGKYLVKILTGELRIGLKEGLLEEAIAAAFEVPVDQVKQANLLLGNIGETAELARNKQLNAASLVPFRPVKFMLASPEETASAIWDRIVQWNAPAEPGKAGVDPSGPRVWIEDKYDGIRCQLHKVGQRVALYSRDLKEITSGFSEIADLARQSATDFVLDGELLAMRDTAALPFSELQRRLGRRERDLFLSEEIPVQFVAFDLLWLNGNSYLNEPLQLRRDALEALKLFQPSRVTSAKSIDEIDQAFAEVKERGNEGLMIKDPQSIYTPGRRGLAWLKLKKAHGTLDCVVIGAEYGHGKRKSVLSDYTFAVRDESTGQLKTIGKAYSGLTDAEIAELTRHFMKKRLRQHGRFFEVEPDTVLEIAFDAIQVSDRHSSGLAMRFPRIIRIRRDKSPADIDTLSAARQFLAR